MFTVVTAIFLAMVAAITVHHPVAANIPINIVLPFFIILLGGAKPFEKLKLSTLLWGRILIAITALGFLSGALTVEIIFWLLRINIAEATIKDYKEKNYLNAMSGVFVLVSTFLLSGTWLGKYFLIHPAPVIFWCLAYTVWNWNFVYLNFKSSIAKFHIAVLSAPLLYVLYTHEIGFWLIMRATSLTLAGSMQVGMRSRIERVFKTKKLEKSRKFIESQAAQVALMMVVAVLCGVTYFLMA